MLRYTSSKKKKIIQYTFKVQTQRKLPSIHCPYNIYFLDNYIHPYNFSNLALTSSLKSSISMQLSMRDCGCPGNFASSGKRG